MNAASTIRRARSASGLGLRELARLAGTSHATLHAYEHGNKVPSVDTFDRIVHATGFRLDAGLVPMVGGVDRAERGDELRAVLDLAAEFPARHTRTLRAPRFGRS